MSISEKIKSIDNKTEKKNKTQYNLDGQTTRIFALTSRNVIKILNMSF